LKHLIPLFILPFALAFASCSKIDKIDKISDKTDDVATLTQEIKMASELKDRQERTKASEETIDAKLGELSDKESDMGQKLAAAIKIFESFEYQKWTGNAYDTIEYRNELITKAMTELYLRLGDLYSTLNKKRCALCRKRIKTMAPLNLGNNRNPEKMFYAVATALDAINPVQQDVLGKSTNPSAQKLSFYDIISSALSRDGNASLTTYEQVAVTGNNKEISLLLLNARVNFLTTLAIKDLVEKNNMNIQDKVNSIIFKVFFKKYGKIRLESKFSESNSITQKSINNKLNAALATRRVLINLDENSELDRTIRSILENLKIKSVNSKDEDMREFLIYRDRLLNE